MMQSVKDIKDFVKPYKIIYVRATVAGETFWVKISKSEFIAACSSILPCSVTSDSTGVTLWVSSR